MKRILLIAVLMSRCAVVQAEMTCSEGQHMSDEETCVICPKDTYMSSKIHRNLKCLPCENYHSLTVKMEHPCNATHNAKYGCVDGHFNTNGESRFVCQKCSQCESGQYEAKPCSEKMNVVCCPSENMDVVPMSSHCKVNAINNDNFCCKATKKVRPPIDKRTPPPNQDKGNLTCTRNMYVDQGTCRPCKPCSFVDHDNHSQEYCDLCSETPERSYLVYCPQHCLARKEGLTPQARVVISWCAGVIAPVICIPLTLMGFKLFFTKGGA